MRFSDDWVAVDGKGILLFKRDTIPTERRTLKASSAMIEEPLTQGEVRAGTIDEERRTLMFPREVIANIRVLPDDFNLDDIRIEVKGRRDRSCGERGAQHRARRNERGLRQRSSVANRQSSGAFLVGIVGIGMAGRAAAHGPVRTHRRGAGQAAVRRTPRRRTRPRRTKRGRSARCMLQVADRSP